MVKEYTVIVDEDGTKKWFLDDMRHREDGPAIEYSNGTKAWYLNDKRHREDGPAVEYANGDKEWYLNGKRHREGGPAIEYADGGKEWYLNGVQYTEEKFNEKMNKNTCSGKIVVEIDGIKYRLVPLV
jgi:hypothetical protein